MDVRPRDVCELLVSLCKLWCKLVGLRANAKKPPTNPLPPPKKHQQKKQYGEDGGACVHEGSCMFGKLDANSPTGYDIAALSDADPAFAGSCGRVCC